jgi:hypothetical protein
MPATMGFPDWSVRTPTTEQVFHIIQAATLTNKNGLTIKTNATNFLKILLQANY